MPVVSADASPEDKILNEIQAMKAESAREMDVLRSKLDALMALMASPSLKSAVREPVGGSAFSLTTDSGEQPRGSLGPTLPSYSHRRIAPIATL